MKYSFVLPGWPSGKVFALRAADVGLNFDFPVGLLPGQVIPILVA